MCLHWTLLPLKSQIWDYIKRWSFSGFTFSVVYSTSNVTGVAEAAVAQRLPLRVRAKERKERKIHRWSDKATHGRGKNHRKWNRTCHISVCKPVNLMTRTAGKSLQGIPKWHQYSSVIALLTFPLPSSTRLTRLREEANQSVSADGAKAAINKVSSLFTFRPEKHPGDRRATLGG